MSIEILNSREVERLRRACRVARATLDAVAGNLENFRTTQDIADFVAKDTERRGGKPSPLGYHGFPAVCCTSKNEVACHGIPSHSVLLKEGDIINVDITTEIDGFHGDNSATFFIGTPSLQAKRLVEVAKEARSIGIAELGPNRRLSAVGVAIERWVKQQGCSVVRELGGHGIGKKMHQDPHVYHHAVSGGPRLRPGMALTVEPIINLGAAAIRTLDDGWTIITQDGQWSAQFEHTLLITEHGYEILTLPE